MGNHGWARSGGCNNLFISSPILLPLLQSDNLGLRKVVRKYNKEASQSRADAFILHTYEKLKSTKILPFISLTDKVPALIGLVTLLPLLPCHHILLPKVTVFVWPSGAILR